MSFGEVRRPGSSDDYCYRHPNRQSFVLCQRCGRTICGDCQIPGPVGVLCPECMKEQRATTTKRARSTLTARPGVKPILTYALIITCAIVYVLQITPGLSVTPLLWWAGAYSYPSGTFLGADFEPWRMITSMFAHSPSLFMVHLLLNMYMLWIVGRILEPVLGRGRFAALYFLSGLGGSVAVMYLSTPVVPTIGASGAIFGILGAFFIIQRRLGANSAQLLILIAANLVLSFLPGLNISWQGHLGGLVVGALVGFILVETRSPARRGVQLAALVAVAVALVAASFGHFLVG